MADWWHAKWAEVLLDKPQSCNPVMVMLYKEKCVSIPQTVPLIPAHANGRFTFTWGAGPRLVFAGSRDKMTSACAFRNLAELG